MVVEIRPLFCALLIVLSNVSGAFGASLVWPTDYDPRYVHAVDEAMKPLTPDSKCYNLSTIGANDHIRNESNQILMTTFSSWPGYNRTYSTVNHPQMFCTIASELQDRLTSTNVAPEDVSLRTKQLLGMAEDHPGKFVAEFWANTSSLFRPAMDADITNPVTSLDFVGVMAQTDPLSSERDWFNKWIAKVYTDIPPYPWTRAGYAYDWGNSHTDVGLTEFIINNLNTGTRQDIMTVRGVIGITSYIYYDRTTDSFNVTGWCDTIWTGSYYLPVNAGGNLVYIHPGVTISRSTDALGEGIVVTDRTDISEPSNVIIDNDGTIQGPTTRNSGVTFTNTGGMLINNGVITGDLKGVSGSDDCTRPIYITNSGTIRGSQYAIQTGAGDDRITTNGLIDGNIATRKGNDTVNVYGGLITGSIDGGEGSNILNFNLPGDTTFAYFNNISNFGDVNVNSGTTRLNGQVSGEVAVASGATFGGNATLSGNLTNSGNVGPGNSIGTITVNGNYTQNAGGHLLIEVAKNSSGVLFGDQLIVDHTATFASGSIIDVSFGAGSSRVLSNNDTFRFITAGSLVDNGSQIAFESIFLNVTNNLGTLTLHRTATFASVARPGNNASMASTFDADAAAAAGTYAGLINQLLFTNAIVFNQSLQQFGPAAYLDVNAATDRTTQYMAESLGGYLRTRRAGTVNPSPSQYTSYQGASAFAKAVGSPCELAETVKFCANERTMIREMPEIDRTRSVWVNPFGAFYGERSNGDHLGFQSNVAGVQFGIDKQADENCILGIGGGYDQMHINTADFDSAGKTDTFRVGPYASWYDDEWYVDSSLTGGFHDNNIGRLVSVGEDDWMSKGLYHANDLSFYLGGGRDRHIGDYVVTPMLSMQYIYYRQNGFTESDGDNVALAVDPLDAQSLRSRVGGQLARTYQWGCAKIVPEVFAGWAHEYLQNDVLEARFVGGVTPFSTDRGGIFRDAGYYGASLTTLPRKHASLFARYNGEYSTGGHFAAVDLGMIVEF